MDHLFQAGIILLGFIATNVSPDDIFDLQNCVGDSVIGGFQPDVNITFLPSTTIPLNSPIRVICDAGLPRNAQNLSFEPLPPVVLAINIGIYRVKTCSGDPVKQCIYDLISFIPGLPRVVVCTASNALGQCRSTTVVVKFSNEVTRTDMLSPGNETTVVGNVTTTHTPFLRNKTTVVPSPIVGNINVTTTDAPSLRKKTTVVPSPIVVTTTDTPFLRNKTTVVPSPIVGNINVTTTDTPFLRNETTVVPSPIVGNINVTTTETLLMNESLTIVPTPVINNVTPTATLISEEKTTIVPTPVVDKETITSSWKTTVPTVIIPTTPTKKKDDDDDEDSGDETSNSEGDDDSDSESESEND